MSKLFKIICLSLISLIGAVSAHAQVSNYVAPLDPFLTTTTPITSITQRTYGRPLKLTGLTNGQSLCLDSNGIVTTTGCSSGGVGTSTNPFMATYFIATSTHQASIFNKLTLNDQTTWSFDGDQQLMGNADISLFHIGGYATSTGTLSGLINKNSSL